MGKGEVHTLLKLEGAFGPLDSVFCQSIKRLLSVISRVQGFELLRLLNSVFSLLVTVIACYFIETSFKLSNWFRC